MSKNRYNSIALLLALPLAFVLWQGSSCRSPNANSNAQPTMNANTSISPATQSRDLRGEWGGQGIAMEVTDNGATIEYDCGRGRISEKISPDVAGKFEVKGVHVREHAGPERDGDDNEHPAVYRGSLKDDTMTLTVELTRDKQAIGTFTLTQGKTGRIRKCR